MLISDAVFRYIKLLQSRVNRLPKELYEILGLKSSEYATDFIRLMYIPQTFRQFDQDQQSFSRRREIVELLDGHRNLIILGGAGTGKTTTLKFICNELCNAVENINEEGNASYYSLTFGQEKLDSEIRSLQSNLALIEERMTEFPLSTDVPLHLIKERNKLVNRLEELSKVKNELTNENLPTGSTSYFIPIFIQLGGLSEYLGRNTGSKLDFYDLLSFKLSNEYKTLPDLFDKLIIHLEAGHVCVLLDGLDELTEESRYSVINMISALVNMYPCQVIITSRLHAYAHSIRGFSTFEIEAFSIDQVDDYLVRWYSEIYKKMGGLFEQKQYAWSLYNKIRDGGLVDVAKNPLILTQIVILHRNETDLTLSNIKVLQKILRLLLFRWRSGLYASYQKFIHLREEIRISDDELLLIAGAIAFQLLKAKSSRIPEITFKEHLVEWIQEHLILLEIEHSGAAEIILEYLQNCDGLLNASNTKPVVYSFADLKIQEYLAAYYLLNIKHGDRSYTEQLPALIESDVETWDSVTIFLCDLLQCNAALMFINHLFRRVVTNTKEQDLANKEVLCGVIVNNLLGKGCHFDHYTEMINDLKMKMRRIVDNPLAEWRNAVTAGGILGNLHDERSSINYIFTQDYWIEIPEGSFEMGRESEKHLVCTENYYIAKYPLTNEQYNSFIQETTYGRVPQNWYEDKPFLYKKNQPVVGMHWTEALDFAKWIEEKVKKKLAHLFKADFMVRIPTEAEWERASQNFQNREALLKALAPNALSQEYQQFLSDHEVWSIGLACVHDNNSPVHDLFNNVWEWTTSAYEPYPYDPYDGRNDIRRNQPRTIRGGYSQFGDLELLRTQRGQCHMYRPVYKMSNVGFRLVIGRKLI